MYAGCVRTWSRQVFLSLLPIPTPTPFKFFSLLPSPRHSIPSSQPRRTQSLLRLSDVGGGEAYHHSLHPRASMQHNVRVDTRRVVRYRDFQAWGVPLYNMRISLSVREKKENTYTPPGVLGLILPAASGARLQCASRVVAASSR